MRTSRHRGLKVRHGRCGGFTIAEVAMAVLVLALAITTALAAMQRAFLEIDAARSLQVAASIMQCQLEKERLFGWAQVSDPAYQPAIDPTFMRNPAVAGRFTLSRALATVPDRGGQMVQVTLTVTWRTFDGRRMSRSHLATFCEQGLYNYIYKNV